ncbi:AAA family ATPase [Fusobacterium nucleatum]|uniref:AAA family ATPase n=3 Tax=Fusobacterium nucleatum TaxID=851 RepID=A0AAX3ME38_FUSNU|nr:AAA family ATPase [Fusobacterium nucleatum]WDA44270.1 AAA family ATPase [Fusobacterium nucleatum]BEO94826.1 AAA family ATPase [Fusobacterium nucleatum]BEP04724.1 AAA family ATPase [Fusobacterium nucleatum]
MKRIGIGLSDFKELIEEDFYYFDKTKFIDEIVKDGAKVKLFTRPRRFGKTLNMSMLKYFFDVEKKEENGKLFKDLYIEKTESFKEQGQYPVIFLSLKDLKAATWEIMEKDIKSTVASLFLEYEDLYYELGEFDKPLFKKIATKEEGIENLKEALKVLVKILYKKYNKKVVILIDEYDSPLVSAYINGYYGKAKDFFKTFYSTVLKDNNYLQMGVLTGIIRVIKAGIFSDLNNLRTYTILSDDYTDSYGLTEEEVEKSLNDYGIGQEISKVKDWYDGYKFGDSEVYNPWSILNFLQDKELRAYWVDTSGNDLINNVLKMKNKNIITALERLFNGEGLRQNLSGTSDLSKILSNDEIWELLLFSGYLTIEEKIDQDNYILRLPNKEVKSLFRKTFIETYIARGSKLSFLMESLVENKIEDYEENLQEILLTSVSYNDTKKGNEAFYHGLIMGMGLYLEGEYITKSNIESGLGRYDFLIEPKNKSKRAFIMEFKSTDSVEKLEEVSKEALKQIEDKKYDISLKQNGIKEITFIGIAFCGKQIKISYK